MLLVRQLTLSLPLSLWVYLSESSISGFFQLLQWCYLFISSIVSVEKQLRVVLFLVRLLATSAFPWNCVILNESIVLSRKKGILLRKLVPWWKLNKLPGNSFRVLMQRRHHGCGPKSSRYHQTYKSHISTERIRFFDTRQSSRKYVGIGKRYYMH